MNECMYWRRNIYTLCYLICHYYSSLLRHPFSAETYVCFMPNTFYVYKEK